MQGRPYYAVRTQMQAAQETADAALAEWRACPTQPARDRYESALRTVERVRRYLELRGLPTDA